MTKYEILLNELSTMESQVLVLSNKWRDTAVRNEELEERTGRLKKENAELLLRVSKLEDELEGLAKNKVSALDLQGEAGITGLFNSLNPKEREQLKIKLQNLISRIDYHLAAD